MPTRELRRLLAGLIERVPELEAPRRNPRQSVPRDRVLRRPPKPRGSQRSSRGAVGGGGCSGNMKLLRLAILTFKPKPEQDWRSWHLRTDGVELATLWADEPTDSELSLFVGATANLSERPPLNEDGFVIIPEEPLKDAEAVIEASANLIAVSERCNRTVSSPLPSIGFIPEDEESREWLDSTNGILWGVHGIAGMSGLSIDPDTTLKLASDRLDGAALLAEALSHTHPTGKFHELVRLFERAFRLGPHSLVQPLREFLAGADMGYTLEEIKHWLEVLRHPATHADRRLEFVLESDVRPVIPRMTQAAYDVLFNKEDWRNPSPKRREVWRPTSGTRSASSDLFIVRGTPAVIETQAIDEVGSYPMHLGVTLNWERMPPQWWLGGAPKGEGSRAESGGIRAAYGTMKVESQEPE